MINAVCREDVEKLRNCPAGPHDAEQSQKRVPADEHAPHFKPRPRGHDLLPGKDQDEVEAGRVEADGTPVGYHPCLGLGVLEVSLEVENVGVVRPHQKVAGHRQRVQSCHLPKTVFSWYGVTLCCGKQHESVLENGLLFERKIKHDRFPFTTFFKF